MGCGVIYTAVLNFLTVSPLEGLPASSKTKLNGERKVKSNFFASTVGFVSFSSHFSKVLFGA